MYQPFFIPGCCTDQVEENGEGLAVFVHSNSSSGTCPACLVSSSRVHSYYVRNPKDLPSTGQQVDLRLRVRRFRCLNSTCPKQTFSEPLPSLLEARARRTHRLQSVQAAVGTALGGEAGARLLPKLCMSVSADTLLRSIRSQKILPSNSPRVLGVDDWAVRKGCTYGTILVDLERHVVVDLLPDRTSSSLESWLREHPGVEIITRDRSTEYARGASKGAPQALQVADRWHLLLNARQMLERYLPGVHARLERLPSNLAHSEAPTWQRTQAFPRCQADVLISSKDREWRLEQYRAVKELQAQGLGIATLARKLHLNRKTARKYAYAEAFPERARQAPRDSMLDPYLPYLHQRWADGCENASELWREITVQGYPGGKKQVLRWLRTRRRVPSKHTPNKRKKVELDLLSEVVAEPKTPLLGAKRLAWLLSQYPAELGEQEQAVVTRVRQDSEVALVHDAVVAFVGMVRGKTSAGFDAWLADCQQSRVRALSTFAKGIEADYRAVKAALETPWSNAQSEGQVTRLKFLKRQMYGRAKFDLLRQRVLLTT